MQELGYVLMLSDGIVRTRAMSVYVAPTIHCCYDDLLPDPVISTDQQVTY
jgi:hypothetical protein